MDVLLLLSVAILIILFIAFISVYFRRGAGKRRERNEAEERVAPARQVRRAAGQRTARRRMQATNVNYQANEEENDSGNEANDEGTDKPDITDLKIGAKKRAKLAAKAEKKFMREAAERDREAKKKKEQELQEERDKQYEKEKEEEQKQEEEEKRAREEKEKREHEEYLKMKEAFSVEEEGYDEEDLEAQENLLQQFIDYIQQQKVVVLEDLAARFNMKTANVIERIQELQASETLTGVIDDRGKFIYISQDELEAVANFIRQRGRVSIAELAESSTDLINLNPTNKKEIEAR